MQAYEGSLYFTNLINRINARLQFALLDLFHLFNLLNKVFAGRGEGKGGRSQGPDGSGGQEP